MAERRFSEAEVAAIFERVTREREPVERQLPASEGLTLTQIQEVGREVGLPADSIEEAARFVSQRRDHGVWRRFLGLPLGVGQTVELGRRLSDEEWERLVVDLRETFEARGRVREYGSLRQWTNGNLQALLEPSPSGQRLRLRTLRGQSLILMGSGLLTAGFGAIALLLGAPKSGAAAGALALAGLAMTLGGAIMLPGWARRRLEQMEGIAQRLLAAESPVPNDR